jgi:hypothetical protein
MGQIEDFTVQQIVPRFVLAYGAKEPYFKMPKSAVREKLKVANAVKDYAEQLFALIYESKCKKYVLWCKICQTAVAHGDRNQIRQHVQTKKHSDLTKEPSTTGPKRPCLGQLPVTTAFELAQQKTSKRDMFNYELTKGFLAADIPLHKLRNKKLVAVLEKYSGLAVLGETAMRSRVDQVYTCTMARIRAALQNKYLYIMIDETTDSQKRFVVNVIVGAMGCTNSVPYLVTFP